MGRNSVDATKASLMRRARADGRLLRRWLVRLALPFFTVLAEVVALLLLWAAGGVLWVDEEVVALGLGAVSSDVCPAPGATSSTAASKPAAARALRDAELGKFAALILLL